MSFSSGDVLAGKYRIVRMIGRGGVGEVYEGENLRIKRKVAIKTLRAEFLTKSDVVQRFEREAQAAGRIGSAHIVEVLDFGDLPDGSRYLVMEFLEGLTLSKHIKGSGRLGAIETAQILMQLLEGLGAAHHASIVHRDMKPANIVLLHKAGEHFVKILDFGVSKFNTLASDELTMTKTGMVVGTPHYMAPEQAKGDRSVDGRADLYAVGVIAYECVTGQVPFSAQTFNELLFKIVLETPPPIESFVPDLDPHFTSLVRKAMAREPNQRFQSAAELQQALSDWLVQVTSGKLGMTLAQTTSFQGGDATVLLDPQSTRVATAQVAAAVEHAAQQQAAQPQAAQQQAQPQAQPQRAAAHGPSSDVPVASPFPVPPAAWSASDQPSPPHGEQTYDEQPAKRGHGMWIAVAAVAIALACAVVASVTIFNTVGAPKPTAASPTPTLEVAAAPAKTAGAKTAAAEDAKPAEVVTAEPAPTTPPSSEVLPPYPAQRSIGGPLPRGADPGSRPAQPSPPPATPPPGAAKPAPSAPKGGRAISGDL